MDGPLVIDILTNTIYVTINLFHNFGIIILCVFFMCTYAHNYPYVAWIWEGGGVAEPNHSFFPRHSEIWIRV